MATEGRDPSGFVTVPPSVVVKATGTTRHDINGLLGIVTSFNVERECYLVHMTKSQSTMAFKKEHLQKASAMESYQAQIEQLQNDARVREKMSKYLNLCRLYVAPWQLSHVIGGATVIFTVLVYFLGFFKTVMTVSLTALILIIAGPDFPRGPQAVVDNFPERARTVMEKQMPILKGKLTNKAAATFILCLVGLCLQSIFFSGGRGFYGGGHGGAPQVRHVIDKAMLERFYNMGYEDAAKGRPHGINLDAELAMAKTLSRNMLYTDTLATEETEASVVNKSSIVWKRINIINMGSIFFLYRSAIELGTDQSTKLFSVGQLAANIQHHTEWWKKALLVLSVYNVCRIFL